MPSLQSITFPVTNKKAGKFSTYFGNVRLHKLKVLRFEERNFQIVLLKKPRIFFPFSVWATLLFGPFLELELSHLFYRDLLLTWFWRAARIHFQAVHSLSSERFDPKALISLFTKKSWYSSGLPQFKVSCGFGQIHWRIPWWKTSFFVHCA